MQQNKTTMWAVGILVLLLVGAGAYYFGTQEAQAPTSDAQGAEEAGTQSGKMIAPKWAFTDKGEDASGIPMTNVQLTFAGNTVDLGNVQGTCSTVEESSWPLLEGELSGAICWYAGGGVEFGLFMEGETYVIKEGQLDEGTAETPGMRGDFKARVEVN